MSPSRSVLLVGEGNFSFSAAMSRFYRDSETGVTATCPQREEETLRQEGAAGNIRTIRESGGTVLFEVDCTKLGDCGPLRGRQFDRVAFNFPHSGRKSGVKKNRQLLRNFFLSCVQVLAEDGEVYVALCNGQGGTPADKLKREWHNSWQIVAMAAEAHLILSDVHPFESEKYQSYKCTGYRSQDKGFHVENAVVHVFARSPPYTSAQTLAMEEAVDGERVQYNVPAELGDYFFRGFLSPDSIHPVRLVQDFLLEALMEKCSVSMTTETPPFLLKAERLQTGCGDAETAHCYWIHLLPRGLGSDAHAESDKDQPTHSDTDAQNAPSAKCVVSGRAERGRSKGAESSRPTRPLEVDPQMESGVYVLRPSLLPHMEGLLAEKEGWANNAGNLGKTEGENKCVEGNKEAEPWGSGNGVEISLIGISGVVFRNVTVNTWALPAFHQLLLRGVFPSGREAIKSLEQLLETLLGAYGVSVVTEEGGLRLTAQLMGLVGRVHTSATRDGGRHADVTVSLNLDLLAVILFSLPDWRLLWSHDPRVLKQFALRPSPGASFHPFSLFPELITFDISFWTGPTWEEKLFHALVREASLGTVEQVRLIDTFSHPDLSQTSYCYRLAYRSHTHALSHTQALLFHKHLESLLSSRLQVTIR